MGIIRCEKGHFYDDLKFDECPHCKENMEAEAFFEHDDNDKTVALYATGGQTRRNIASINVGDDERTVGIYSSKGSFYPVVGWLVCISGNERGRDYRITSGQNFLGRSYSADISIMDDPEVSREKHCIIIYDPKSYSYMVTAVDNLVYLNDEQVKNTTELKAYDVLTVGQTKLQFVPYCKEGVEWK